MSTLNPKTYLQRIDGVLILLYLSLVLIGFLSIYAVEHTSQDIGFFQSGKSYMRQLIFLGIGLFISIVILFTDSKIFPNLAYISYAIGVLLLLVVIVAGREVNGSKSFLVLGPIQIQPAEMVKFFTALALAKFLSSLETDFSNMKHRLIAIGFAIIPLVIIIAQRETGLALVYLSFLLAMYREGLPNTIIILGFSVVALTIATLVIPKGILFVLLTVFALGAIVFLRKNLRRSKRVLVIILAAWGVGVLFSQVLVPVTFTKVLKAYQVQRIYTMIGQEVPVEYAQGIDVTKQSAAEYNVSQSKIAIASGGVLGKGFLNGAQTKYNWVPEQRTDFIFCSVAEQFGFVGSTILVLLYLLFLFRIVFIAERQRSKFSRVFAYCLAGIIFFHILINLGMTIGLAPVIGIPLPLISYGGTSLLTFTIMIFVLVRLDADRNMILR